MYRRMIMFVLISLTALLTAGCGGNDVSTSTPPPPDVIIDDAINATRNAESFRLVIRRSGAPVYIDTLSALSGQTEIMRAEGDFVLPNRLQVDVKIRMLGMVSSAKLMAIGLAQYLSHPVLTGGIWLHENFLPEFDPGEILAEDGGLERSLRSMQRLALIGIESMDGNDTYHLWGIGNGADVAALTLGLIGGGDVEVNLWVSIVNRYVLRLNVTEPNRARPDTEPDPPIWDIELYDYNADIVLNVPDNVVDMQTPPGANPGGEINP